MVLAFAHPGTSGAQVYSAPLSTRPNSYQVSVAADEKAKDTVVIMTQTQRKTALRPTRDPLN